MNARRLAPALWLLLASPARAATWTLLPAEASAVPYARSASRDAPVFEYAYGPRAQSSLGGVLGLAAREGEASTLRFSGSVLLALENARRDRPEPSEAWRTVFELTVARKSRAFGGVLEPAVALGRAVAYTTGSEPVDPIEPDDIPFGGGGYYVAPELAGAFAFGRWRLEARASWRLYANLFPDLVDQEEVADVAADFFEDGLAHRPALDVTFAHEAGPFAAWHGALLFPHDDNAHAGAFTRLMLGTTFAGAVIPFVSVDAGNGQGALINREELRFSAGVRYAPR